MALTAMDIYKLLPKTNCGDCGTPTCLAFAMQLANKNASLDDCPHASDEAKDTLASASQPPVRLIKVGAGDKEIEIGNETVMFRHEETFHHACGLAVQISDELSDEEADKEIEKINNLWFERVGEMIGVELIAIKETSRDAEQFAGVVKKVVEDSKQAPVLMSYNPEIIGKAFELVSGLAEAKPLIYAANEDNYEQMVEIAKKHDVALVAYAEGLEALADLTAKIADLDFKNIVLDSGSRDALDVLNDTTQIRRQGLKNNFRPLGYPTIAFATEDDKEEVVVKASTYVAKYAGIVVIKGDEPWQVLPLLALRQNIYTDPRVPPTIEPGVYEVGEVGPDSPVLLTTNFALTYFTVLAEVEASRIPAYILSVDTEGQSVLTAYSSENLNAEDAAKAMNSSGLKDKLNHSEIIIPGYVAVMSGSLEAESGWSVKVGPREAGGLPNYLKEYTS